MATVFTVAIIVVLSLSCKAHRPKCCRDGWHLLSAPLNTKCIRVFSNRTTWPAAGELCIAQNGRLVTIHSDFENQFIFNEVRRVIPDGGALYGIEDGVWLGGKTNVPMFNDTSAWFWVDGTYFSQYMRWAIGQPNFGSNIETCLGMYTQASLATCWNDYPPTYSLPFVCQHSISATNCNRVG